MQKTTEISTVQTKSTFENTIGQKKQQQCSKNIKWPEGGKGGLW
jgi:hypothetical protein